MGRGVVVGGDGQIDQAVTVFVPRLHGDQHGHVLPVFAGQVQPLAVFGVDFDVQQPVAGLVGPAFAEAEHDRVGTAFFGAETVVDVSL